MLKNLLNYFWLLDKLSIKQLLAVARETSASLLVDYTIWDSQIVSRGDSWSFLRFSIWACQIVDIQRVRHQGNCYCIIPVRLCGRCGLRCSVESNAPWAKSFGDACAFPLRPFWDRRAFAEAFSFPDAPKSIASLLPTSYRLGVHEKADNVSFLFIVVDVVANHGRYWRWRCELPKRQTIMK